MKDKGFTLIELLIVMIILGLLAALVAPKMFGKIGLSRQKAAKSQITLFETALDTYRLDVGSYPTTAQSLKALRVKPEGLTKWDGPYLPKDIPKDPWGYDYVYRSPADHHEYEIISVGADGIPGGEGENADIYSWKVLGEK